MRTLYEAIISRVCAFLLFSLMQKGYRSLHTAARKDYTKAAKLLLQKNHPADVEAPVRLPVNLHLRMLLFQ